MLKSCPAYGVLGLNKKLRKFNNLPWRPSSLPQSCCPIGIYKYVSKLDSVYYGLSPAQNMNTPIERLLMPLNFLGLIFDSQSDEYAVYYTS